MEDKNLEPHMTDLRHIWDALVRRDELPQKVDAIVLGGCSDLGLAERAAELYHAGVSKMIVVSGYKPENIDTTEAKLLSKECVELGIPPEAILLEEAASNTGENILFSAKIIKDQISTIKSVILIHKPFMSLRFLATAEAQWPSPQPHFYATCQTISFEDYWHKKGLEATTWEMLGDFKRMDEYVSLGFQTEKLIPATAKEAYKKIVSSGFTTR